MTPKEKAEELIAKMTRPINDDYYVDYNDYAKECAIIAVDEILQILSTSTILFKADKDLNFLNSYYLEVKQEIEAL
jgi:hypothetical protein